MTSRLVRAAGWLFAGMLAPALALSLPVAALVGASLGAFPDGDARLFAPGADAAADLVRLSATSLRAALHLAGPATAIVFVVSVLPLALALAEVCPEPRAVAPNVLTRGVRRAPTLLGIAIACLLVRVVAAIAVGGIALTIAVNVTKNAAPMTRDLAQVLALAVAAIAAAVARVLQDLAAAAAVRHDAGVSGALLTGLGALRDAFWTATGGYLAWTTPMVAVVALASVGASRFDHAVARGAIHVVALAAIAGLRAGWLAAAADRVGPPLMLTDQPDLASSER